MTWPMVAYALIRELPAMCMIVVGGVVAVVVLIHIPEARVEAVVSAVAPAVIAALSRSRPAPPLGETEGAPLPLSPHA